MSWLGHIAFMLVAVSAARPAASEERYFFFGDCQLPTDPNAKPAWLKTCVRGRTGAEVAFFSGHPEENAWLRHARAYSAFHVNRFVSVHWQGRHQRLVPLGDERDGIEESDTDLAVGRLGNSALHKVRFTAGHTRLPFGIDHAPSFEFYNTFENRLFWASPRHGAYFSFDDLRSMQVDIGYGSNEYQDDFAAEDIDLEVNRAVSARIMYDIAALEGSRLMVSGYSEAGGRRRVGFGFINTSRKGDLTQFEWIRIRHTPSGKSAPFEQLIRVGYLSTWRSGSRWALQFDDERRQFRMGIVGHDFVAGRYAMIRGGLAYYKSETGDGSRRWYLVTGVDFVL